MFECSPVSTNVMRQSVDVAAVEVDSSAALGQREVVRHRLVVVEEVLADHVAAVAEGEHEILVPEVRVVAHEVPEDRPVADVHERLRNGVRVLAQSRAEAAAEQHDFHVRHPSRGRCPRRREKAPGGEHAPPVDDERASGREFRIAAKPVELVPARHEHDDLGVGDGVLERGSRRAATPRSASCVGGRATGS